MKTKYIPNSKLPKGAIMLRRIVHKQLGGWVEQEFDAKIERLGLMWWRVKGGFGGSCSRYPKENWCADLPTGCLSVSNEDWDGSSPFGYRDGCAKLYGSFDKAVTGETERFIDWAEQCACKAEAKAKATRQTVSKLRAAIEKAQQ